MENKKKGNVGKNIFRSIALVFAALFLFLTIVTAVVDRGLNELITEFIGHEVAAVVDGGELRVQIGAEGGTIYEPIYRGDDLAERIVLEGAVLLRNEMNEEGTARTLPLRWEPERNTVAVLGWSATSWVPGGNGSGMVARRNSAHHTTNTTGIGHGHDGGNSMYAEVGIVNVPGTNTLGALELAGITPYQPLIDFYMNYGQRPHHRRRLAPGRRPNIAAGDNAPDAFSGALKAYDFQFYTLIEPYENHADYGDEYQALLNSAAENNDTAIVVIGRHAGESIDAPKVQFKGIPDARDVLAAGRNSFHIADPTRHYLEISTEEEALLTFAGANFDNVIVLINSTNTMELGFLDTIPGIDAALFVGATGIRSATAIPRLLWDRSERRSLQQEEDAIQLRAGATVAQMPRRPFPRNPHYALNNPDRYYPEGDANRYLWPVVSPSGRTAGVFAYDMRTGASWNNSGDSDQDASAVGFVNTAGILGGHAPLEMGQRYFSNVDLTMGLYPLGSGGIGSSQGVNSNNSNFNAGGGYRNISHQGVAYIDYSEGIFVGYKWYETANEMGVWDEFAYGNIPDWFEERIGTQNDSADTNTVRNALRTAHNEALVARSIAKIPYERVCFRTGERINPTGYDAVVQFPFGFGLSYTEFEWTVLDVYLDSQEAANRQNIDSPIAVDPYSRIYVRVEVKNVGAFHGMDVVQLYVNPPWTEGGLEKASANLSAFRKTYGVLEPNGGTEIVTMWFDVYDMASFDTFNITGLAEHDFPEYYLGIDSFEGDRIERDWFEDGFRLEGEGGFVLENGDYELTIQANSNQVADINNATITLTVDEDGGGHLYRYDPLNERENDWESTGGIRAPVMTRFSGEAAVDKTTGGDGVPIDDSVYIDGEGFVSRMSHLTRNDFTGTFPVLEDAREITEMMQYVNLFRHSHADTWMQNFGSREGFLAPDHFAPATPFPGFNSPGDTGGTTGDIWRGAFIPSFIPDSYELTNWYEEGLGVFTENISEWFGYAENQRHRTRMGDLGWQLVHNGGNWNAPFHVSWDALTRMIPRGPRSARTEATANANSLIGSGSYLTNAILWNLGERPFPLIGRPRTPALDASNQVNSFRALTESGGTRGIGWPNSTTVAQTFNYRLARRQGWEKGMEARARAVFGMLSPGVHVHRSPLNGRNFEYYSESAYLAGIMASNYIRGLMDMGIYTYIKHFAVYAQESNRSGLYIFLTEQALREIYFVPFRMGILRYAETGHGSVAMMSGYSRLGAVYEGGSYHLLTTVLRREWGFRGSVMTDWADNGTYMSMDQALRAGGDKGMNVNVGVLTRSEAGNAQGNPGNRFGPRGGIAAGEFDIDSNAFLHRAREGARNITYAWLFAEYIGARFNPVIEETVEGSALREIPIPIPELGGRGDPHFNWIRLIFILIWALGLPLAIIAVFLAYRKEIFGLFKKKKKAPADGVDTGIDANDPNAAADDTSVADNSVMSCSVDNDTGDSGGGVDYPSAPLDDGAGIDTEAAPVKEPAPTPPKRPRKKEAPPDAEGW